MSEPGPGEQETLAGWSGWGAVPQIFDGRQEWTTDNAQLRGLLSQQEYRRAEANTLNAHLHGPGDRRLTVGRPAGRFVVDPRGPHRHRTGCGGHLTRLVVAVADHQPSTNLIELRGVVLDTGRDLGLQRRCQHLPGTVADDLIEGS